MPTFQDTSSFKVVVNDEEQYSIWNVDFDLPHGWRAAGFEGDREACLDWISAIWTDLRPLSLRSAQHLDG